MRNRFRFLVLITTLLLYSCSPNQIEETDSEPLHRVEPSPTAFQEPAAYPVPQLIVVTPIAYPESTNSGQINSYPQPVEQTSGVQFLKAEIINSYPHNRQIFTQGLVWDDGFFFESGGLVGQSALYQVNVESGDIAQQKMVDADFFAEGIALLDDRIIMLTWQNQTAIVFDKESFEEIGRFSYEGQGWGLCWDESRNQLWMSDGSNRIVSRNPATFEVTGEILVTLFGAPVTQINELECVHGRIYANIWRTDKIIRIQPETGFVDIEIDATGLLTAEEQANLQPGRHVLNGIAYDEETGHFYLTGKNWPRIFEVEFQ